MDVKLLRIDSRLVHGQVANNRAGSLGTEAILVIPDGTVNDELCKTLTLQTGSDKVKVHVLGMEKAARVHKNPKYEALKAVIVVETSTDIVCLFDLGAEAKEINVGGMVFKQGANQVSQAVYANPVDAEVFKEIDSHGTKQYIQQASSTAGSDLMGALREKGLL